MQTDLCRKIHIVTKQNALFNKKLNFLINFRSVLINLHNGVPTSRATAFFSHFGRIGIAISDQLKINKSKLRIFIFRAEVKSLFHLIFTNYF